MKAKEKAIELIEKYYDLINGVDEYTAKTQCKQCAIIAVDEIITEYENNICNSGYDYDHEMWDAQKREWQEVKQEIYKL